MKLSLPLSIAALSFGLAACGGAAAPTSASSPPSAAASAKPASAPASAPSSAAASKQLVKLVVSQPSASLGQSPGVVADKKGFFQEQGIQVEIVTAGSGAKNAAALIGGSSQFAMGEVSDALGAADNGQDVRVFALLFTRPSGIQVLSKSAAQRVGITDNMPLAERLKRLKGLKMAISTPGSGSDTNLRFLLSKYGGLDPERDVQIVNTGSTENAVAALAQGAVDGASLSPPQSEMAMVLDDAIALVDGSKGEVPEMTDTAQNGLWATGKWLDANPQLAAGVVAAIWKSMDYLRANSKDGAEIERQTSWEQLDQRAYDLAWQHSQSAMAQTPAVPVDAMKKQIDFVGSSRGQQLKVTPEQIAYNKAVDQARQILGR